MIANITDLNRATECLEKVHRDLENEKMCRISGRLKTGIMIEIPSAAIQAESMARQADFFSIGTNDLTQYTLAADRGNPELASYQDALHPAVLRLIEMVVSGASKHGRIVAVCGEAASDERAAAIFVGLGRPGTQPDRRKNSAHQGLPAQTEFLPDYNDLPHTALHCQTAAEVRALALVPAS